MYMGTILFRDSRRWWNPNMTTLLLILKKNSECKFFLLEESTHFSSKFQMIWNYQNIYFFQKEVSFTKINVKSELTTVLIHLMSLWSNRIVFTHVRPWCVCARAHWSVPLNSFDLASHMLNLQTCFITYNNQQYLRIVFLCSDKKQICADDWQVLSVLALESQMGSYVLFSYISHLPIPCRIGEGVLKQYFGWFPLWFSLVSPLFPFPSLQ